MATSLNTEAETPPADWVERFVSDIPSAVALFDRELRYIAANASWLNAFGLTSRVLVGQRHQELDPRAGNFVELQRRALGGEIVEHCELSEGTNARHRVVSARPRRSLEGEILGVVAMMHEIPVEATEKTLREFEDGLTGLAGRHRFMAAVESALTATGAPRRRTAVFLVDIDNFKGVNDLYGTRTGDRVLTTIANRLVAGTRSRRLAPSRPAAPSKPVEGDTVARLGADEFGIVLGGAAPNSKDAASFARRLLQLIADPIVVGDQRIRLTANVGYVITSAAHASEDDVLRDLDAAVQESKARGPNNATAWEPSLTTAVGQRLALLDQMRRALDEGEFVMHYQPIFRLSDGHIVGAEALLRWNHPSDGLVAPAAFLPVLEESGLIVPVGGWIMREVVRQMRIWQMLYGRDIIDWVSINVSARQFNDPDLLLSTLRDLDEGGFPLNKLKLEITESAVMRDPEMTRSVLNQLQELGIRVAVDDFGTGYSALGALRHYPVDTIKIDRGFTSRIETDDGKELVLALMRIARVYGADVVAEGIETTPQREILQAANCGFGQGYLFAKPMDGSFFGAYALTHLVQGGAGR